MPTINSSLQGLLNDFAIAHPQATQAFTDAFNASPTLLNQYNTLAACGYLKGFAITTQSGVGGLFQPSSQTFEIPVDANGNVSLGGNLIFVMGHEGQHAENLFTTMSMANQSFQMGVSALASQPGNQDYTSLLQGMQQANNADESTAQLAGWNAYVDYMRTINTINGTNLTFNDLLLGSGYSQYFTNNSNLTVNPDFSIVATPANVAAEGNIYFLNPNAGLGSQRNLTYPNWYGASNVDTICRATNGSNITIDFAALHYDASLIKQAFPGYFSGICTVTDSSSNTIFTFKRTDSGTDSIIDNGITKLVDTTISGQSVNITYSYDANGAPIPHVNSINGKPPLDQAAADAGFGSVPPGDLVTGVVGTSINGLVAANDAAHPSGLQTVVNALPTVIDALSFIRAIQTGQPLPVVASGLNLVNALTSTTATDAAGNIVSVTPSSYGLAGAAGVGNGILSILSLDAALKRGDTLGAVVAGAQAVSYGVSAYTSFATANQIAVSSQVTDLSGTLNGTPGTPGVLPYLSLVNSIAQGDSVGVAVAVADMVLIHSAVYSVPYLGWAYAAYDIITSLFGDTPAIPAPWGNGRYVWNGTGVTLAVAGQTGGDQVVSSFMNQMLGSLNTLIAQEQQQNPGSALGIIPGRMPSISYDTSGFSFTDIDPVSFEAANDAVFEVRRAA